MYNAKRAQKIAVQIERSLKDDFKISYCNIDAFLCEKEIWAILAENRFGMGDLVEGVEQVITGEINPDIKASHKKPNYTITDIIEELAKDSIISLSFETEYANGDIWRSQFELLENAPYAFRLDLLKRLIDETNFLQLINFDY